MVLSLEKGRERTGWEISEFDKLSFSCHRSHCGTGVDCLPGREENPSVSFRHTYKRKACARFRDLRAGEAETREALGLLTNQVSQLTSFKFSERPCLKK